MARFTWADTKDLLEDSKKNKINQLSIACGQEILNGFKTVINEIEYHFNYEVDNQQNFLDTMRLFENNMIKVIGWNAYLDEDKVRLELDKDSFNQVYIEGVKHKTNCLTTLNDYLIPMVKSAKTEDDLNLIYWGQGILSDDASIDDSKTIEKKTNKLEIDNARNANGILELTNLMLMGGFG